MISRLLFIAKSFFAPADTDWQCHESFSGPVMRRTLRGKTEHRPMTPYELQEYRVSSAAE
jgi:hypothetical protein